MSEWFALAERHLQVGDWALAEEALIRGLEMTPRAPASVWYNLGLLRAQQGDWPGAIAHYQQALQVRPDLAPAWLGLGIAQMSAGDFPAAETALHRAIALAADPADGWLSLGNLYYLQERLGEARAALTRAGDRPAAWLNWGNLCLAENNPQEALGWFNRVLAQEAHPEAQLGRAIAHLTLGHWEPGWRDFGARWAARGCPYAGPRWEGQPLAGQTLLVVCEQGFGDSLQFVRYVRYLPTDGPVVLRCPEPLQRLFACTFPEVWVMGEAEPLPPYDGWVSLMDLPRWFGIQAEVPYVNFPAAAALPPAPVRVGVVARSDGRADPYAQRQQRLKSVPWEALRFVAQLPGVQGYSLQKEGGAPPELVDLSPLLTDFAATAALVSQLDAVVTVDTAIAHLAGALGKPVWILLPYAADWRWLLDRPDSVWYPTATLCRQPAPGDWPGAIAALRASLCPYLAQRLDEQAQRCWQQGDKEGAFARWKAAVQLDPQAAYLRFNWGLALQKTENRWGAIALYRDAWRLAPSPETAVNLGGLLADLGNPQAAGQLYAQALARFPHSAGLHRHLAGMELARGEAVAAETHARAAIALNPTAAAWSALGSALGQQQRIVEAKAAFDQALRLDPHHLEAQLNLGCVYQEEKNLEAAIAAFRRSIDLATGQPNTGPLLAKAHFHLACLWLMAGRYPEGWEAYEWRWQLPGVGSPPQPQWQGEPVDRLVVWGEQGFGDVLQFVRFVPRVRSRCRELYLVCRPPLQSLLQDSLAELGITVLPWSSPLPPAAHIPLLSLPRLLQTNLNTLPAEVPYLRVSLAVPPLPPAPLRLGLVWQSGAHSLQAFQQEKSCGWEALAPLMAALPHIQFYSLQPGGTSPLPNLVAPDQDFRATAAYLMQLDGLITVDTAAAHLAGALAKPTWVLLPYAADWRWGLDRPDSPWYRTLRLLRQPRRGDWETPIQEAIAQIREFYGRGQGT